MDILTSIFKRNNLLEEYRSQEALFVWNEVMGENTKEIATPLKVIGRKLLVATQSSSAQQELSYMEDEFLEEINARLQGPELRKIKFIVERGRSRRHSGTKRKNGWRDRDLEDIELDEEERLEIETALEGLDLGEELRNCLRNFLTAQKKEEKARLSSGWQRCPRCGRLYEGDSCLRCERKTGSRR